jgi:hypothetical protein
MGVFMMLTLIALPYYKKPETYLVVVIAWDTAADIDLHVYTPRESHYYFKTHNRRSGDGAPRPHFPDEDADLSMDMQNGGAEVWRTSKADAGEYRIALKNFDNKGSSVPTEVKGVVLYSKGSHEFKKSLRKMSSDETVLTLVIGANGAVAVQSQ